MTEYEREYEEIVTKKEKVTECDYCRLFTTDDIDDNEEFGEILLNPTCYIDGLNENQFNSVIWMLSDLYEGTTVDENVISNIVRDILDEYKIYSHDTADVCPHCVEQLFGDGPNTMFREGTGYLKP